MSKQQTNWLAIYTGINQYMAEIQPFSSYMLAIRWAHPANVGYPTKHTDWCDSVCLYANNAPFRWKAMAG
jgi:hypothetical protein